jgi:hypothetical protein
MSTIYTSVQISEDVTEVAVTESNGVEINISEDTTVVEINNLAIPPTVAATVEAENIEITPTGSVTATNLEEAINQLANQQFSQASAPSGVLVNEGDFWYETDTETLHVYREVSSNVFNWVPISLGTGDSDTLDGGSY